MSQNLTMSPDLGTEDWDPDVITRMIFIGPGAHVSEQEIVTAFTCLICRSLLKIPVMGL